ncbi:hypothetical protein T4D_6504 [Trichinella pseudospiralis]|uniref:Uncharacterized protein n=1 Tax=Trichinella pseudospiralis TaxID=6337 RepID=A0A0V1F4Y5_TRIPS|nr:hypothetical protein T4D_6504 [Trichinella pseudospiralis]
MADGSRFRIYVVIHTVCVNLLPLLAFADEFGTIIMRDSVYLLSDFENNAFKQLLRFAFH